MKGRKVLRREAPMVKVNSDFFVAYNVHSFCWHGLFRVVFEIIYRCLYHSMARANLNKSVWLVTNTTTASKYIPKRTIDCFDSKLTDHRQFYDHIRPFFANYINIFQKTEIQMVILRCLTVLNPNWFTSYDTKSKYFYFRFVVIL